MHVCIDVCAPNSACIDEVSQILLLHMYACVYRCVCSKFRVSMCVFQITAAEYASIGVSSLRLQLSDCGSMVAARLGMKVMKAKVMKAAKAKVKKAAKANKSLKTPSMGVRRFHRFYYIAMMIN